MQSLHQKNRQFSFFFSSLLISRSCHGPNAVLFRWSDQSQRYSFFFFFFTFSPKSLQSHCLFPWLSFYYYQISKGKTIGFCKLNMIAKHVYMLNEHLDIKKSSISLQNMLISQSFRFLQTNQPEPDHFLDLYSKNLKVS